MAEKDFHISEKYNFRHALIVADYVFGACGNCAINKFVIVIIVLD
jgi:hypothetical protein